MTAASAALGCRPVPGVVARGALEGVLRGATTLAVLPAGWVVLLAVLPAVFAAVFAVAALFRGSFVPVALVGAA